MSANYTPRGRWVDGEGWKWDRGVTTLSRDDLEYMGQENVRSGRYDPATRHWRDADELAAWQASQSVPRKPELVQSLPAPISAASQPPQKEKHVMEPMPEPQYSRKELLIKQVETGGAKTYFKSDYEELLFAGGDAIRKPGETKEAARTRYFSTPEGQKLYAGYQQARDRPLNIPKRAEPAKPRAGSARARFDTAVQEIATRDKISIPKASVVAMNEHKDLYQQSVRE